MWLSPDRSKSLTENRSGRESQVEPSAAKSSSRSGADFLDLIRKDNVANLGNRMYQASQSMMEKKVSEWCQTKEYRRCWSSTLSAFSWLHAEFKTGVTQQTFCDDEHDLLPGPMILISALMIITKLSGWKWLYCSIIINCSLGRCCTLAGLRTRFHSSGRSKVCTKKWGVANQNEGLFRHNNWLVILATEPSRPIYGLLPFGAQTDKAAAKWHRRCTPQCEDGLKIFHRNQYRSRTSRLPVPCDAAATPLCWAFPPTSLTFKPKLKNGSRSADCEGHCKVASWYLERRYVAFRFSFVDVHMLNPNKGVLSMKIIRWVFYRILQSLEPSKPQKSWAEWWSYVFSSNIPQLTLHFLCNLQLQRQFLKTIWQSQFNIFFSKSETRNVHHVGYWMALFIIQCIFNRFWYQLQTPLWQDNPNMYQNVLHSQRTQRSSMLGSHRYRNAKKKEVPFAGRLLEHIYTVKRAKASNSVN